jgi:hypothetical protein
MHQCHARIAFLPSTKCYHQLADRVRLRLRGRIYGLNFCSSGSRVFSLLGKAGAKTIIQTSLITPLMWMASGLGLAAGCLCGWGAHEQVGSDGLSDDARRLQLGAWRSCRAAPSAIS